MTRGPWLSHVRRAACVIACCTGFFSQVFGDGLPGEYLVTQRWRQLLGAHSPLTNPAFMTEENYISGRGAFAPTLQGAFRLWELGVTVPIGLYQGAGFTWLGQDDGEVQQGTIDPATGRVKMSGDKERNVNSYFMLSYAINPWNRLSVGVNAAFAYQSNFGDPIMGIGADLGATYRLLRHPILGEHILGVASQNLLAPSMGETATPDMGNSGEYARGLKISWLGHFWENRIDGGLDFSLKDFLASTDEFQKYDPSQNNFVDVSKEIEWGLTARAGTWIARIIQLYLQLGFDQDVIEYWGLAGGVNVPSINGGRDFSVLYQYNMKTEATEASSHTFYTRVELGKHREEVHASRVATAMSLSPNLLYNKALGLYHQEQYWDAFLIFAQIAAQFPDFFKMDWVTYYMGSCQEQMDMRKAAEDRYGTAKQKYRTSPMVPYADLGMMRLHYRNGNNSGVSNQYIELNKPDVPDSLRYHAYYLMGETLLRQGRNRDALHTFEQVPEHHPEYVFACHSAAVAHARLDQFQLALRSLEKAVQAPVNTEPQKEVVNRSYVFFGYIFYEQQELAKAVTALRLVPKTSFYYTDALLGLGWSAVKARNWQDCIRVGRELRQSTTNLVLKGEGTIIEACGYMMQKKYNESAAILKNMLRRVQAYSLPPEDSLSMRRESYKMTRAVYDLFSEDLDKVAGREASGAMVAVFDSMQTRQSELKGQLQDFLQFRDDFHRRSFFARSYDEMRNDMEYMYAIAKKHATEVKSIEAEQEMIQEQKKIDEQIEKLKEQMEDLE